MSFDKVVVLLLSLLPQEKSFEAEPVKGPSHGSFIGSVKGSSVPSMSIDLKQRVILIFFSGSLGEPDCASV